MATKRYWHCKNGCAPIKATLLFDALLSIAKGEKRDCPQHPGDLRNLELNFPLGLGATDPLCTVIRAFLPKKLERWIDSRNGSKVTFYPFLVVLRRHGPDREYAAWLPYWHIVEFKNGQVKNKYGQWAPFMDEHLLHDLLKQAREHGFLASTKGKLPDFTFRAIAASGPDRAFKNSETVLKVDGKRVFVGTIGKTRRLFDAGNGGAVLTLEAGTSIKAQAASIHRIVIPRKQASKGAVNLLLMQWRKARSA